MILGNTITAGSGQECIGAFTSLGGVFNILSLVTDAVAGYDMDGNIILANENFADLCGLSRQQLMGIDVRSLLLPPSGVPSRRCGWPFPMDGEPVTLSCRRPASGTLLPVVVRAKPLGESDCFVLTARAAESVQVPVTYVPERSEVANIRDLAATRRCVTTAPLNLVGNADARLAADELAASAFANGESSRLLHELVSAAGTGDPSGVHDLLTAELRSVVDADAAALYLAEEGGFVLKSFSGGVPHGAVPTFIDREGSVAELPLEQTRTVAFDRAKAPGDDDPDFVSVVDKATGTALRYGVRQVPPLASFFVVPVMFGTMVVAFSVVGWIAPHALHGHDAKVLDILSYHHATELMTAAASAQSQSSEQIQNVSSELLVSIEEKGPRVRAEDYLSAFETLAGAVGCEVITLYFNQGRRVFEAEVPGQGIVDFPFTRRQMEEGEMDDGVTLVSPAKGGELEAWLSALETPRTGFLMVVDRLAGRLRNFLVVRDAALGPVDSLEATLYKRFVQDVYRLECRETQQAQETFISRTLQTGIGNNLQRVDGLTAKAIYNSATETAYVGGDFYDLIQLPEHRACIILGDVAGKGVQAASVSAAVRTSLGAYAWEGLMPAHAVRSLNDFFLGFSSLETFATVFMGVIDLSTGLLTYCSAGHPPALLLHPQDGDIELLSEQSGVVGAFREMVYRDGRVRLRPGDEVLLYTDGATEARKPDGTFFGEIGLRDTVVRNIDAPVEELPERILSTLFDFTESHLDDDVALMTVRYDGLRRPEGEVA